MPNLSIIPARAVMDRELSHTHLRVLCAIGIHTNKLGGNVWTSVKTLATEAGVSERTVQMACAELEKRHYITRTIRMGKTNMYDVQLQPEAGYIGMPNSWDESAPPQDGAPPQQLVHPTPAIAAAPKRPKGTTPKLPSVAQNDIDALIAAYPERPEPHIWPAVLKEVNALRHSGVPMSNLLRCAERYAVHCKLNGTEPKYVKTLHRWLADGMWKVYDVQTVHGRTREDWKRSGQDVLEFDRLAGLTQREEVAV